MSWLPLLFLFLTHTSSYGKSIASRYNELPSQQLMNEAGRTERSVDTKNVITVPTNCPPGQELINGVCRDVWRQAVTEASIMPQNLITVPTNCPAGQQLINGVCRDVWRSYDVTFSNFLERLLEELNLKNLHLRLPRQTDENFNMEFDPSLIQEVIDKSIITVPNQCPSGYRPDANGICRPILQ